jgi:ADP-ribosylglycohydrolase
MKGGGLGGWEPGEWTDDTQMAICIAEEAATGTVDPLRVAGRFLDWYRSGPVDVGVQTSSVLSHSADAAGVAASATNYFGSHPDRSAGNGSLMCTAPLALASLGDDKRLVELAMSVSPLTHADPITGEACALWCIAIDRAVREGRLDGARDGIAMRSFLRRVEEGALPVAALGDAIRSGRASCDAR